MSSAVFTIVLATHLIAANFATAGPFVALWLEMRGRRRGDERATSLARQAIATSMGSLAVAMVLGLVAVGLMWWRWPAALDAGFGSVPQSRLWFGGVELAFYFVCLAAYLPLARGPSAARSRSRQATLVALALLAGTDVAYHFPPLFAVVGTYGANPDSLPSGASFLALMLEPEPLALTIHFLLASIAVGGVGLSWLAIRPGTASPEIALTSGRLALAATLGQLLSGGWLVVATN
ncbi:MAG TPA: hypothetical protein VG713_17615, partial [Pirellulales bacterium]|nr:hypothetical protein [Pirellulales bacterium]